MTVRTCQQPTLDGVPCTHLIDDLTRACAAGHPNLRFRWTPETSLPPAAAAAVGDVESILVSAAGEQAKVPDAQGVATRDANGDVVYRHEGRPHRLDGPAVITATGFQGWFRYGRPHREDGPAELWPDGTRRWLRNGLLDRADGPAVEVGNGLYAGVYWRDPSNPLDNYDYDDDIERQAEPYGPGSWEWCRRGVRHRDDGPAAFIVVDKPYQYRDPGDGSHHTVAPHTRQEWWVDGKLHCDGGPAVVASTGEEQWWRHGELHREDGPAVTTETGKQTWYRHGQIHRDGGPAVVYADGRQQWWHHGKQVESPSARRFDDWQDFDAMAAAAASHGQPPKRLGRLRRR